MLCLATLGLLAPQPPHVAQLPRLCCGGRRQARPPVMRVSVREAEDAELRFQGGGSRIRPISVLVAQGFVPADASEQQINVMAAQLARNLAQKFSSSNPEDSALLLAESGEEVVAACGVEVMALTPSGLDQFRYEAGDPQGVLADRPFLSNLAVRRDFRRRGIAKRLCRAAEQTARGWGYTEVLLKVEADNRKARSLYRSLGYRVIAVDREAERPEASSGGLKFVPTTQVAMRKDLRIPPPDVLALRAGLLGGGYYLYAQYVASGVGPQGLITRAEELSGLDLQALLPALAAIDHAVLPLLSPLVDMASR